MSEICEAEVWASGKRDVEGGPFSWSTFNLYGPAVVIANTLDDSKADSQSLTLARSTKKTFIQKRHIKGFNADTGIGNREPVSTEIHPDKTTFGILHRIAKQIHERGMKRLPI